MDNNIQQANKRWLKILKYTEDKTPTEDVLREEWIELQDEIEISINFVQMNSKKSFKKIFEEKTNIPYWAYILEREAYAPRDMKYYYLYKKINFIDYCKIRKGLL